MSEAVKCFRCERTIPTDDRLRESGTVCYCGNIKVYKQKDGCILVRQSNKDDRSWGRKYEQDAPGRWHLPMTDGEYIDE